MSKPQRVIQERQQSTPAKCEREIGHRSYADGSVSFQVCSAQMQLLVTKSPLRDLPYEELVVRRCLLGHLETSDGVLTNA